MEPSGPIQYLVSLILCFFLGDGYEEARTQQLPVHEFNRVLYTLEQDLGSLGLIIYDSREEEVVYRYSTRGLDLNRAYPPGSVAKVLSALIFLRHPGAFDFDPLEKISCGGKFYPLKPFQAADHSNFHLPKDQQGTHYFRCSLRDGHGACNLHQALVHSCNHYFLTIASRSETGFYDFLRDEKLLPANRARENLTPFMHTSAAIGEGGDLLLSLEEVAGIFSIFGTIPPKNEAVVLSGKNRSAIVRALKGVVEEGTLKDLEYNRSNVIVLGGKTGTATHRGRHFLTHGWNVILLEYRGRPLVLVSFVKKGSGGKEARKLSEAILSLM